MRTTRRYILEDASIHDYRCQNLTPYKVECALVDISFMNGFMAVGKIMLLLLVKQSEGSHSITTWIEGYPVMPEVPGITFIYS
jgi:hypothetical protein